MSRFGKEVVINNNNNNNNNNNVIVILLWFLGIYGSKPTKHKGVAQGQGGLHQPCSMHILYYIYRVGRFGYNQ